MFKKIITSLFIYALIGSNTAIASDRIGVVGAANKNITAINKDGDKRILNLGDNVYFKETIKADTTGNAQLMFLDKSALTIGPNSSVVIDEFVYNPVSSSGNLIMRGTKGTFRFIGGALSKKNAVKIKTPVGTIGIRGGIAIIDINPVNGATNATFVYGDVLTFENLAGDMQSINDRGTGLAVNSPNDMPQIFRPTTAQLATQVQSLAGRPGTSAGASVIPTDDTVGEQLEFGLDEEGAEQGEPNEGTSEAGDSNSEGDNKDGEEHGSNDDSEGEGDNKDSRTADAREPGEKDGERSPEEANNEEGSDERMARRGDEGEHDGRRRGPEGGDDRGYMTEDGGYVDKNGEYHSPEEVAEHKERRASEGGEYAGDPSDGGRRLGPDSGMPNEGYMTEDGGYVDGDGNYHSPAEVKSYQAGQGGEQITLTDDGGYIDSEGNYHDATALAAYRAGQTDGNDGGHSDGGGYYADGGGHYADGGEYHGDGGGHYADGGEYHGDGGGHYADGGEYHGDRGEYHGDGGGYYADGGEYHGDGGGYYADGGKYHGDGGGYYGDGGEYHGDGGGYYGDGGTYYGDSYGGDYHGDGYGGDYYGDYAYDGTDYGGYLTGDGGYIDSDGNYYTAAEVEAHLATNGGYFDENGQYVDPNIQDAVNNTTQDGSQINTNTNSMIDRYGIYTKTYPGNGGNINGDLQASSTNITNGFDVTLDSSQNGILRYYITSGYDTVDFGPYSFGSDASGWVYGSRNGYMHTYRLELDRANGANFGINPQDSYVIGKQVTSLPTSGRKVFSFLPDMNNYLSSGSMGFFDWNIADSQLLNHTSVTIPSTSGYGMVVAWGRKSFLGGKIDWNSGSLKTAYGKVNTSNLVGGLYQYLGLAGNNTGGYLDVYGHDIFGSGSAVDGFIASGDLDSGGNHIITPMVSNPFSLGYSNNYANTGGQQKGFTAGFVQNDDNGTINKNSYWNTDINDFVIDKSGTSQIREAKIRVDKISGGDDIRVDFKNGYWSYIDDKTYALEFDDNAHDAIHGGNGVIMSANDATSYIGCATCDFVHWGVWTAEYDVNAAGTEVNTVHMIPYIAGQVTSASEIGAVSPLTATYTGNVIGNIYDGSNITNHTGTMTADINITSGTATILENQLELNINGYTLKNAADLVTTNGIFNQTGLNITGNGTASASGAVNGALFGPNAENIGGNFHFNDATNAKDGTGVYLGTR